MSETLNAALMAELGHGRDLQALEKAGAAGENAVIAVADRLEMIPYKPPSVALEGLTRDNYSAVYKQWQTDVSGQWRLPRPHDAADAPRIVSETQATPEMHAAAIEAFSKGPRPALSIGSRNVLTAMLHPTTADALLDGVAEYEALRLRQLAEPLFARESRRSIPIFALEEMSAMKAERDAALARAEAAERSFERLQAQVRPGIEARNPLPPGAHLICWPDELPIPYFDGEAGAHTVAAWSVKLTAEAAGDHSYHGPTKDEPHPTLEGQVVRRPVPDEVHEQFHRAVGDVLAGKVIPAARKQMREALDKAPPEAKGMPDRAIRLVRQDVGLRVL
jgi:hypothetical protein